MLEAFIRKKLNLTRTQCKFKAAIIPKGWACVEVKTFAKILALEIKTMQD